MLQEVKSKQAMPKCKIPEKCKTYMCTEYLKQQIMKFETWTISLKCSVKEYT